MLSLYLLNAWILRFLIPPVFLIAGLFFWRGRRDVPSLLIVVGFGAKFVGTLYLWMGMPAQMTSATHVDTQIGFLPWLISQTGTLLVAIGALVSAIRIWTEKRKQAGITARPGLTEEICP